MSSKTKGTPATEAETAVVERVDYGKEWWVPQGFDEASRMAHLMAKSDCVPYTFKNKPGDILAAWSLGAPLGLSLLATLRFVTVINGVPAIWGDGALAVTRAHPLCQYVHEEFVGGEGPEFEHGFEDDFTAICTIMRRGDPKPVVRRFSVRDAKTAKLWQKRGNKGGDTPWITYPKRMLQMRARSWAMRDGFADALCGMPVAEEIRDITSDVKVVDAEVDTRTESQKLLAHSRQRTMSAPPADPETHVIEQAAEAVVDEAVAQSSEEPQEAKSLLETIKDTVVAAKTVAHLEAIVDRVKDLYEEGKIHSSEQATITQMVIDRGAELTPKKGKGRR